MAEIDSRKASLIAEIEVSRFEMRRAVRQCEANLNPVSVLRRSVVNNSAAWLSSAALMGLALSQVVRLGLKRPISGGPGTLQKGWETTGVGRDAGTRHRPRSWMLSLGGLAYDLVKPALIEWATARLSCWAQGKMIVGSSQTGNGVIPGAAKKTTQRE